MVLTVLIVSFILDSLISNFIPLNSVFVLLLTLMSLIIIYPYFNNNKNKYFLACFATGAFYDLIYTNTIIIHAFLFLVIGFIITRLNLILSNNYVNVAIMALIVIVIYRIITYGLLLITANMDFNFFILFKSIYSSLILNIIYVVLIFIITDKIATKLKIRRAN